MLKRVVVFACIYTMIVHVCSMSPGMNEKSFVLAQPIPEKLRGKQLDSYKKYNAARELFLHAEKSDNKVQLNHARIKFEEIINLASKDPEALSKGTLLGTKYLLAIFYLISDIAPKNYDKIEELILPITQAMGSDLAVIPAEWYLYSCVIMVAISFQKRDYSRGEQFYRKIIMYDIQFPEEKKTNEQIRKYVFLGRINLSDLIARRGNIQSLKEAISFYQSTYRDFNRYPFKISNNVKFIEDELRRVKGILLSAMREHMPQAQEESLFPVIHMVG